MISSIRPLLAVLLTGLLVFSFSSASLAGEPIVLSDEVQLKIADGFLEQGEYYRGITEFKKLLILFPDSERADYASFAIGLCYFRGDQHDDAEEAFIVFRSDYPESPLLQRAMYLEALSCLKTKRYDSSRRLLTQLSEEVPSSEYAPSALAALALAALSQERVPEAVQYLQSFCDRYALHPARERVQEALVLLHAYDEMPRKSPTLAAVMSAILPGSGYVYARHSGDGVMAFAVNVLFALAEVVSFEAENYAAGAIIGGVGLPFYIGNIWGSANAARKQNVMMDRKLREQIDESLSFIYSDPAEPAER